MQGMKPKLIALVCLLMTSSICWSQPFGLSNRVGNTTLKMPPVPAVYGLGTSNAFGNLTFTAPVAIVSPPGETNRLFIVEQSGRISVITNLANPTKTLFMSLSNRVLFNGEQGLLGLAFHPGYLTNRFFFVDYVTPAPRLDRLSRFEISPGDPNQGLTNSEVILISQPDDFSNHNAGDLHFGADGYLYVSLGDEGDANDTGANSQRIDKDFFSGILRLDVDKLPGSLTPTPHTSSSTNYAVPADNPFVGATSFNGIPLTGNVRTEFWAVGLRNPWRFSFDLVTSNLYCGDVGQGTREEVDVIVKGGNYGWNYREGNIARPGSGAPPAGFSAINPLLDYPRTPAGTNVGFSVTGGVVYRGNRLPELNGAYIFGDYGSGNIWSLRHNGTNVTSWAQLLADAGVAAFGLDPSNGDLLYADVTQGVIKRLTRVVLSGSPLPETLADTGAFSDTAALTPQTGILPYAVNLPAWSDNAMASRWFYVPTNRTITYRAANVWTFPTGAVWIQHLEMELTNGVPESRRRLETRFLMRDSGAAAYGVTYRWDSSQTNATLVPENGLEESLAIDDGGTVRTQVWRYPSRSDCLKCHTSASQGGLALGFGTVQLNRDFNYGGIMDNQIRALNNAGFFAAASPATNLHALRSLPGLADEAHSVESRVRSYLAVNCSHCHQPGGSGAANFNTRIFNTLPTLGLIDGLLVTNGGNVANRVIKPGSLAESMLLTRLSTLGAGRMPPLGNSLLDTQAIQLVSMWITNDLIGYETFAQWQTNHFGSTNAPEAAATADPDGDRASNQLEYFSGTDPNVPGDGWGIGVQRAGDGAEIVFPRLANRGLEIQWSSNLISTSFWRFLNIPENRPFFSSSNTATRVPDAISNAPAKFYRARVYEH